MSAAATPKLWPYDRVRREQDRLITAVESTLATKQSLVAHAPTGLGKTAASLAPALETALEKDAVVIFMSGRHTQHEIAIQTAREIKERHGLDFGVVDLIGKKWFCLQPGVERLQSRSFQEYCKAMREDRQCEYYENLKKGESLSPATEELLRRLQGVTPLRTEEVKAAARTARLCPYEVTLLLAKRARLIITDYLYLFDPGIRERFLAKLGRKLEECILIVDEAHNLPDRVKEMASGRLTTTMLERAVGEAEKHGHEELASRLRQLHQAIATLATFADERGAPTEGEAEKYLTKEALLEQVERITPLEELLPWMEKVGDSIREEQRASYIGAVALFLKAWEGSEERGVARIVAREREAQGYRLSLHARCLDPALLTHEVFEEAYASILMSGTLTPPGMYAAVLGVSEPNLLVLESPFPEENRLNLIIPKTSTKYTQRSEWMWQEIAEVVKKASLAIPGNVAVFFPSYAILEQVHRHLEQGLPKTILAEHRGMAKDEKGIFLNKFKAYAAQGAILLAVITGNFGEGIDLPGELLKGVIVVGLPLSRPDLETKALIQYYDAKFRKGWEYGYTIPAFNKTLQSAGRCIRSSKDKGAIIFLDERYEWPRYHSLFPKEWRMRSTLLYEKQIREFFGGAA